MVRKISTLQIKLLLYDNKFITLNLNDLHYHDRVLLQGLLWLDKEPYHNDIDEECCPDFSCCEPDLFEKNRSKRKKTINNFLKRVRDDR